MKATLIMNILDKIRNVKYFDNELILRSNDTCSNMVSLSIEEGGDIIIYAYFDRDGIQEEDYYLSVRIIKSTGKILINRYNREAIYTSYGLHYDQDKCILNGNGWEMEI